MHQLGIEKRQIEAFIYLIKGNVDDEHGPTSKKKRGSKQALEDIGFLAQKYGGQLSRQSERNLPRTKFSHSILSVTKREAHDYAGMLIGLLIALLSDCGREIIQIEREMNPNRIADQVQFIEIILGMEEWLKHGSPTQEQTEILPEVINDFIDKVNLNGQREGMSTKLIKNHLYFHLPKYIELWDLLMVGMLHQMKVTIKLLLRLQR